MQGTFATRKLLKRRAPTHQRGTPLTIISSGPSLAKLVEGSEIFHFAKLNAFSFRKNLHDGFVRRRCCRKVIRNLLKPLFTLVPHRMDGENLPRLSSVTWLHARHLHTTAGVQMSSGMARVSVRTRWAHLSRALQRCEALNTQNYTFFTQLIDPLFIHQQFAAPIVASRAAIVRSPEHVDAKLAGWARTAHR